MNAFDEAFIKAYRQHSPAKESAMTAEAPRRSTASSAAISEPATPVSEIAHESEVEESSTALPTATLKLHAADETPEEFQPALQVDSLAWPTSVAKMAETVGDRLEPVVNRMIVGLARGRKVVAFEGCRRGDGCTTILLAAARRLAERGLRVIVVDADFDHPRLARRLGLAPESGWETVLARRMPLAEVVIESLAENLAVLPLCEPAADEEYVLDSRPNPCHTMDVLRHAYDLVLVDLGRLNKRTRLGIAVSERPSAWIDAVVLVQNVRGTPPTDVAQTYERLGDEGIADVAVVENFV